MSEKIKVTHPVTGESWEMTSDQIYAAYRCQEFEYRKMDAKSAITTRLEWLNDDKETFKEEYGRSYEEALDDADYLAERFLDAHDCNSSENDLWDSILDDYLG